MMLPVRYKRHADAVMSARLQELETMTIAGLHDSRNGIVSAMTALSTIRDQGVWQEERYTDGGPRHSTFESYLQSFIERLREVDGLDISVGKVAEYLRHLRRFVSGLGLDASEVLTTSPQALRQLETMAQFRPDGTVKSIASGLNEGAIPGGMNEDAGVVVKNIAEAIVNAPTTYEAIGLVKAISNKPEVTFVTGGYGRRVGVRILSYRGDKPYIEKFKWDEKWPEEAEEEYFRRLKVRSE